MAIKSADQITIIDVTDAYSVMLTSETYTFVGEVGGTATGLTCTTQAVAYCGTNRCSAVTVTAANISCPDGISASVSNSGSNAVTITFTTTAAIKEACEATIPVSIDGITINKKFSFAVAKTGAQGEPGVAGNGIASVVRYYKLATSKPSRPTTNPPSGWTTTEPTYTSGSTNNLYLVDCTIYTDETFAFSSVSLSSSYAAAKKAYNALEASMASRGENLIFNGDASLRDNTNFSKFNYYYVLNGKDMSEVNTNGFFRCKTSPVMPLDNLIPIDINRTYELSFYLKNIGNGTSVARFVGLYTYEAADLQITSEHVSWVDGTTTKLAQDLNDGDTCVYLESVENFDTTVTTYNSGLIFWDYTGVTGETFEPETYSRHVYTGLWSDGVAAIDKTNNTITLSAAWSGGTKTKGTPLSQSSGTNNTCITILNERTTHPSGETYYITNTFGGVGNNWENAKFPVGTNYISPAMSFRGGMPIFTNVSLVSRDVANLLTRVTDAETSITTNKNAIELKAEKTEVTIAVDSVTKDIGDLRGDLANYATQDDYESVKTSISTLTQTSNDFTMKFQEIDSKFGDQSKYIRYSEDGIEIGYLDDESNNGVSETKKKLKLTLDNDRISFTSDGKVLGYWDGNYFYTGNIYVETKQQARFGNFAFTPYDDGSLAFVRVGE